MAEAMRAAKLVEFEERATHDCQYVCLRPEELDELCAAVRRLQPFEKAWRDLKANFGKESGTGCHYSTDEIVSIMAEAAPERGPE